MSLNLTIDQGNSSAKVVLFSGNTEIGTITLRGDDMASALADFVADRHVDAAIAASVAQDVEPLLHCVNAPTRLELTAATPVPLVSDYSATLGADRMAAAVGAFTLYPGRTLLVCDLGTACTFDVVSATGRFLGGNIAPGVGMRLRALHSGTKRLPAVSGHDDVVPTFGTDTPEAMRSGAIRGVVAEIEYYARQSRADHVLLTGGWAAEIADYVTIPVKIHPHLVNQGLNSILLYNETL